MTEYTSVEQPLLRQLEALGWTVIDQGPGYPEDPRRSLRTSFEEVGLRQVFRDHIRAINPYDDGTPWLTDEQLDNVYEMLLVQGQRDLLEANEQNHLHLIRRSGTPIQLHCDRDGRLRPVQLLSFENIDRNAFHAINQFRLDPPGASRGIRPDIVLFVNGIPLVVIECKAVDNNTSRPIHDAIEDLRVYANRRSEMGEHTEGDERLFLTNLFNVATCGTDARAGSLTASATHYYAWRDIVPEERKTFVAPLGEVRSQETLVQGMLARDTLLDLLRHFTVFMDAGPKRVKVVARYQQYRAVHRLLQRLRTGATPLARSGVIWHTQGSGKSLTMVFAIRKLRSEGDLKDHRVLLVNDRRDLERQLTETAALTGETPTVIERSEDLDALKQHASDLVLAMVHKFQEKRTTGALEAHLAAEPAPTRYERFPTISESQRILVMVDEAHRTQSSDLGENLINAFPNATRIGFTGTPLVADRYKREGLQTITRFGDYIDRYLFREAIADGATLPVKYIGRTANVELKAKEEIDAALRKEAEQRARPLVEEGERRFPDVISATEAQMAAIRARYGDFTDILDADARISDIAEEIVRHYTAEILPNGFKAQIVANSQLAAARYKKHIDRHIAETLATCERDANVNAAVLARLRTLKSAVVLSGGDKKLHKEIKEALEKTKQESGTNAERIRDFKRDFDPSDPKTGLGILVVCDMLLTGFDAPIEQVMYLDKKLVEHNLLQTVARVNRVRTGKDCGIIVDFVGLMSHLDEAFELYGDEKANVEGSLEDLSRELARLDGHLQKLIGHFISLDVEEISPFVEQTLDPQRDRAVLDQALLALAEPKGRALFEVLLEDLLRSLNMCFALPQSQRYVVPAKRFAEIQRLAREEYRDRALDVRWAAPRIRALVDAHLVSKKIAPEFVEVDITSAGFLEELRNKRSARSAAATMEHAARVHLKLNLHKDPALYQEISQQLEQIVTEMHREWEDLKKRLGAQSEPREPTPEEEQTHWQRSAKKLETLRERMARPPEAPHALSPTEAPLYRLLLASAYGGNEPADPAPLVALTRDLHAELKAALPRTDFWQHANDQRALSSTLVRKIIMSRIQPLVPGRDSIVADILKLAKANHDDIIRS